MKLVNEIIVVIAMLVVAACAVKGQNVWVNQAGYLPGQQKLAYTIDGADSFYVIDAVSRDTTYRGGVRLQATNDPSTGLTTYICDFSSLTREGVYRIQTDSGDTSVSFMISKSALTDVYRKSLKAYYFQRCGEALIPQYAGVYARAVCHRNDALFHPSTGKTGSKVTTGGWHDAGDYGKYVASAGITVGTLLLAYELFPDKFGSDDLNIPESGNSVPDILDQVRYELEWLLEMQDSTDGGVYFKVTPEKFEGFVMPTQDNSIRYIYQKSTAATGDFAAVMAEAGRIYLPFDSVFASRCLTAAESAWQYLQANPTIVPSGGFHNPPGTGTGEYGDGDDSDERLWASAELFETTGADSFNAYYKTHFNDQGLFRSTMSWQDVRDMAQIAYLTGKESHTDSSIRAKLQSALIAYCSSLVSIASRDGFNVTLSPSGYVWGSNSAVLNNGVLLIIGYMLSGNIAFYNTALDQLNYILGCNVKGMSYVTGVGTFSPMNPHHRPSYADGIAAPVPGLMVGGPDRYLDDPVLQSTYTASTPPAQCYIDNWQSYASNEIAINWNAPLVFVAGYFNETLTDVPAMGTLYSIPNEIRLEQNFPNPFNPSTTIIYQVPDVCYVSLIVYDVLGRQVAVLVDKHEIGGTHSVRFDAENLPNGVYFYRLHVRMAEVPFSSDFIQEKKLLLLK